jgi:hypothetical protein
MQNLDVAVFEYPHRGHIFVPENGSLGTGGGGMDETIGADKTDEG